MKKFLSVALALIIALSAFSISVFAAKPSVATENAGALIDALTQNNYPALATQAVAETDTDAPEEPEETQTRYAAWCANAKNLEEFKYSVTSNLGIDAEICIKGDAASYELNYSGMQIKLILKDSNTYLYFVNFPFFYLEIAENVSINELIDSITPDFGTFVSAKEENGYYVEEYDEGSNGFTALCYFKGDKLEKIEEFNTDSGVKNYMTISYSVKNKEVRTPWYAVDATPLASIILFMLLFA